MVHTVALVNVPTTGTCLRGIARIDKLDMHPFPRRFVGDKTLQLAKTPIAHRSSLLAACFGTLPDVGQVLHDQGISWLARANNLFGDHVIAVCLKSFQSPRQLFEMSPGRFCTFALQCTSEAKGAVIAFLEVLAPKETRLGSDGQSIDPEINSNGLARWLDNGDRTRNDHVQPERPCAVDEISALLLPRSRQVLLIVRRNLDGYHGTVASLCRLLHMDQRDQVGLPIKTKGTRIVAHSAQLGVRGLCSSQRFDGCALLLGLFQALLILLSLLLAMDKNAFDGFGRLDTSRTNQLAWQVGIGTLRGIGKAVQFQSIADVLSVGKLAHLIKAGRVLLHRLQQECRLFRCWPQLYADRARLYHVHLLHQ